MLRPLITVALLVAASAGYLGLGILGLGGRTAFVSHPALVALAIAFVGLVGAALYTEGNLSPGVREDRGNRWVLAALGLIGLVDAYLLAATNRLGRWTS